MNQRIILQLLIACIFITISKSIAFPSTPPTKMSPDSLELIDLYPGTSSYFTEADGNVSVTFVHNLDLNKYDFSGVCENTSGESVGNFNTTSKPADASRKPLIYSLNGLTTHTETTIHFKKTSLATVKYVTVYLFLLDNHRLPIYVLIDPNFARPKTMPRIVHPSAPPKVDSSGTPPKFTTAEGLTIETNGTIDSTITNGQTIEMIASSGIIKDRTGSPLLRSRDAKLIYNIDPALLPFQ